MDPTVFWFVAFDRRPSSSSALNGAWRRVLAKAVVRYRPAETLRHSCASLLLSAGAPVIYVMSLGGWASPNVMFETYRRGRCEREPRRSRCTRMRLQRYLARVGDR